jgi:hypothetical protein
MSLNSDLFLFPIGTRIEVFFWIPSQSDISEMLRFIAHSFKWLVSTEGKEYVAYFKGILGAVLCYQFGGCTV